MTDTAQIESVLSQHFLFNGFEKEALAGLIQRVRVQQLEAGETLFSFGDTADRFYLVKQGQVKLSRIAANGQEKVIEIMSANNTFAEAVMFMQKPIYPVTAQALDDCVLYAIPNQAYLSILTKSTESCLHLLGGLSMRLHGLLQELDHLAQQNAAHRLVRYLVNQLPADVGEAYTLTLTIPKHVLASKLSIKPESFSRLLSTLSHAGIISVEKQTIVIHDTSRLKNYE